MEGHSKQALISTFCIRSTFGGADALHSMLGEGVDKIVSSNHNNKGGVPEADPLDSFTV